MLSWTAFDGHDFGYDGGPDSCFWFTNMGAESGETKFMWENGASRRDIIVIKNTGNVGIGTTAPQGKLDVNGEIYQRGSLLHADYVFEPEYKLESIEEHSKFMWENKHLKAIPKAKTDESGKEIVEIGARNRGFVEELEKAHIYIEQLHKRNKELEERLSKLEKLIELKVIAE